MGIVGVISFLLSLVAWRGTTAPNKELVLRAARVRRAESWVAASSGADVKVNGVIKAADEGAVEGPLTGVPAVWIKLDVLEDSGSESFASLFSIIESHPFMIDGVRVVASKDVRPTGNIMSKSTGPVVEPSPRMRAFLERHGKADGSSDGFVRRREYVEHYLVPGEHLLILGTKVAQSVRAEPSGYRDGEVRADYELRADLVFAGDESEIEKKGRRDSFDLGDVFTIGIAFIVIASVLGTIVGLIVGLATS